MPHARARVCDVGRCVSVLYTKDTLRLYTRAMAQIVDIPTVQHKPMPSCAAPSTIVVRIDYLRSVWRDYTILNTNIYIHTYIEYLYVFYVPSAA